MEAVIDSVQMVVGEQTCIHLSALVKNGQPVLFPQLKTGQMLGGVEVVETPKVDTVEASDGNLKVTQHIRVTAWDDSLYYIPGMTVKVNGKAESSKSLALKVLTVDVDTIHPNQFYGPRDVQDNPFKWSEWSNLLWLTFLLVLLYVLCWLALLRLRSKLSLRRFIAAEDLPQGLADLNQGLTTFAQLCDGGGQFRHFAHASVLLSFASLR